MKMKMKIKKIHLAFHPQIIWFNWFNSKIILNNRIKISSKIIVSIKILTDQYKIKI